MKYIFESQCHLRDEDAEARLKTGIKQDKDNVLIPVGFKLKAVVDEESGEAFFCKEEDVSKKVFEINHNASLDYLFVTMSAIAIVLSVICLFIK